jgi:hypothetical protein
MLNYFSASWRRGWKNFLPKPCFYLIVLLIILLCSFTGTSLAQVFISVWAVGLRITASNNKVVFKEMFFFRFSNKKIVDGWGVVDIDGVKSQISKQK